MQIKIFNIPVTDAGDALSEMNRFLAAHKVLEVEQQFCRNDKGGYWSFCVRHITGSLPGTEGRQTGARAKVDYKEILSEKEFAIFSRLRVIRKKLADEDGVPAYAVFTDEELSGISRLAELSESAIKSVPGIGEKKAARYGKQMMDLYNQPAVS